MGQTIGRAPIQSEALPFLNIPRATILNLWEAFNDIAEGFGLTLQEFRDIIRVALKDTLMCSDKRLDCLSETLFHRFDTDRNGLVDSLEVLSCLGLVSGMSFDEKVWYLFGIYDFDESGVLTVDEFTLALRASVCGLIKVAGMDDDCDGVMFREREMDRIAANAFVDNETMTTTTLTVGDGRARTTITREELVKYARNTPEIVSWIAFFGDFDEVEVETIAEDNSCENSSSSNGNTLSTPPDLLFRRCKGAFAIMDRDSGADAWRAITEKGCDWKRDTEEDVEAWRQTIPFSAPSDAPLADDNAVLLAPRMSLTLEWIYGRNSLLTLGSNNAVYTNRGDIVYPAGAVAVKYSHQGKDCEMQHHYMDHSDYITCIAVYYEAKDEATLIATGQIGAIPKINVWDADQVETLVSLFGFHKVGISHIDFSPSGTYIISIGMDKHQTIALYEWRKRRTVFTSRSTTHPIHDVRFLNSDHEIATVGYRHVHFWTLSECGLSRSRGLFGKKSVRQTVTCVVKFSNVVVTGGANGDLCLWEGRTCVKTIKGHHCGSVTVLRSVAGDGENNNDDVTNKGGLCCATSDGKIHLYNYSFELYATYNTATYGEMMTSHVTSLDWDISCRKLLVGLRDATLFEMSDTDGSILSTITTGHTTGVGSNSGSSGLAIHPLITDNQTRVVTCGNDTLRVWDVAGAKKSIRSVHLDGGVTCVCYHPTGTSLAVGLGDGRRSKQQKNGAFAILNEADLTVKYQARDAKKALVVCRFSENGSWLAFGSRDGAIYLYDSSVGVEYDLVAKCRGHTGEITHLDFGKRHDSSTDDQDDDATTATTTYNLQSNSSTGEILFWNMNGEKQTPRSCRDTLWDTRTCPLSWDTQGVHSLYDDGTVVRACHLSRQEYYQDKKTKILATVDNVGRIRLYQYPVLAMTPNQCHFLSFTGHSAQVTHAQFSRDGKWLFTIGGEDSCLFQWRCCFWDENDLVNSNDNSLPISSKTVFSCMPPHKDDELDLLDGSSQLDRPTPTEIANNCDSTILFAAAGDPENENNFTVTRPWQRSIVAPSHAPPDINNNEVHDALRLEWVHGYAGSRCRSNLHYGHDGDCIVYNIGKTVVTRRKKSENNDTQSFHSHARDEITCVALHPFKTCVAVGHVGAVPSANVFDYESGEMLKVLKGHFRRAISTIAFSPNGKLLVACGQDDFYTVVVYDWENGTVVAIAALAASVCCDGGKGGKVLDASFTRDGKGVILLGVSYLKFGCWEQGSGLCFKDAVLGEVGVLQPFFSIGWVGTDPVIGTATGHLYRFLGRKLESTVSAHESTIYTIHSTNEGLVTGSRDGTVKIWTPSLSCRLTIDLKEKGCLLPKVKSVCWDNERAKILVGTAGNDIFEFSSTDGSSLIQGGAPLEHGHSRPSYGLAMDPLSHRYITVSDDHYLRFWDLFSKKCTNVHQLEMPARACAFSPDGTMIAIGFGSPVRESAKQFDGKWIILGSSDLSLQFETRDARKYITNMQWSRNGEKIAVGSFDNKIYIYGVVIDEHYNLRVTLTCKIERHNSYITHFDFDTDARYLRSNCGAYELLFFETETGLNIPAPSRLKDVTWETKTCTLCWEVQGIWPMENDGCVVTSVDTAAGGSNGNVLTTPLPSRCGHFATGDNYGRIRLWRHPTLSPRGNWKQFGAGHCGKVAMVRWSLGDSHVVTLGAEDGATMVWRYVIDEDARAVDTPALRIMTEEEKESIEIDAAIYETKSLQTSLLAPAAETKNITPPWITTLVEPSSPPPSSPHTPSSKIQLRFAHGVQTQCLRDAVKYSHLGQIISTTSNMCIIHNKSTNTQRFYREHTHQVASMAVCPRRRFAASGDFSNEPCLHVWDAGSITNVSTLKPFHRGGITSIAFSDDGRSIVTVGGADVDRTVAIWFSVTGEWHDGMLESWGRSGASDDRILFAAFTEITMRSRLTKSEFVVVTGGATRVKFWRKSDGNSQNIVAVEGLFQGIEATVQPLLCGVSIGNDRFVTGAKGGQLYVWFGRSVNRVIKAHDKNINALCFKEGVLVSGSEDGSFTVWSSQTLEQIRTFSLNDAPVLSMKPTVRSLDVMLTNTSSNLKSILIGTGGSEVYELSFMTGHFQLISEGHYKGECWGLAMHPIVPDFFCTTGDDGTLRLWSISENRVLKKLKVGCMVRAICWSHDGEELLLGCGGNGSNNDSLDSSTKKDGVYIILDVHTMKIKLEGRDSKRPITCAKFSPDAKFFALASMDHNIYIYDNDRSANVLLRAVAEKHNAPVTSFDFSSDSLVIQSDATDEEHLCFNTDDGNHFSLPSQLKNVEWATQTCTYGWSVQGIWCSEKRNNNPVSVDRSNNRRFIVVGDIEGRVKLYHYPVLSKQAGYRCETSGHTHHVSNCRFSCDDKFLVTIGKTDRSILVWTVQGDDNEQMREDSCNDENGLDAEHQSGSGS